MSRIGEKRPAEESTGESPKTSPFSLSGPKFSFRPSSLGEAAASLSTYNSTISKPESPSFASTGGFLKFKPDSPSPLFTAPSIMTKASSTTSNSSTTAERSDPVSSPLKKKPRDQQNDNLFLRCLRESRSTSSPMESSPVSTPSKLSDTQTEAATTSSTLEEEQFSDNPLVEGSKSNLTPDGSPQTKPQKELEGELGEENVEEEDMIPALPKAPAFGSQRSTAALLPEVELMTGEEGEKHITQIHCKLFVFDGNTLSWREKGRGELRLNDAPRSEGAFQSRLVMRAAGSLRLLLNTHLWAQMTCEQPNPKNMRISAQDGDNGISIFLIVGTQKDIRQVFTAVDRRLQALRRTATKMEQEKQAMRKASPSPTALPRASADDNESVGEGSLSPGSSPEGPRDQRRVASPHEVDPVPTVHSSSSSAHCDTPKICFTSDPSQNIPVTSSADS